MQKGEPVEYIEDRRGNHNINNKYHLIRTMSSKEKSPKLDQTQDIHMQNMARVLRPQDDHSQDPAMVTFGATIQKDSTEGTDSKRLTF